MDKTWYIPTTMKNKKKILFFFFYFKGSCCSSTFGNNISNYLNHMLNLVDMVTQPGSLTYEVNVIDNKQKSLLRDGYLCLT
jgi:hypothetical protein